MIDVSRVSPSASGVWVDGPQELVRIHNVGLNCCVWRREVPAELANYIDTEVLPREVKRTACSTPRQPGVERLLDGLPRTAGFSQFRDDLLLLRELFLEITGTSDCDLKLEAFGGKMCERFHVDWVPLRLICSYAGPGTQWLDDTDVVRDRLGPGSSGLPDEQSGLIRPGGRIQAMARFEVGLMKGECWPGQRGRGLVHRSPRATEARRVLFKIDPGSK